MVEIEYTVSCDKCGKVCGKGSEEEVEADIDEANGEGWELDNFSGEGVCPDCKNKED